MNMLTQITVLETGTRLMIPLRQLIKSPRNARKTAHSEASIEAKAASIAAKGILQNLVVEPERDEADAPTGCYFVTIGEGRRLAQVLRVERGEITDEEPIPCVIDTVNNPHEISLDENVTREAMHPADQFEAFRDLNERDGLSAEDIAARFGVSPRTVKQRLRLGSVSPKLMQVYRDGELTLDQLMAFCVSEDHARQESVFDGLTSWQNEPYHIRRLMTQGHVMGNDRRARFVGMDPYVEAGGQVERDLFTDEGDGRFVNPELLTSLTLDRLTAMATALAHAEGWKWGEAYLDFPYIAGMERSFPKTVSLSDEDAEALETAQAQLLALSEEYEDADELPDEIDTKMSELETEIARLQALTTGYLPDDKARAGIIVSLKADGQPKFERGLIRAEDVLPEPEPENDENEDGADDAPTAEGGDGGDFRDDQHRTTDADEDDEPESPMSEALVRDLTAHRTLAFRLALGDQPEIAGRAMAHLLVMDTFYKNRTGSCLEIRPTRADLRGWVDHYDQSSAVEALDARHLSWAEKMPPQEDLWPWVLAMDPEDLGLLMAHCIGLTVNVVRGTYGIPVGLGFADQLATSLSLDVREHWKPTASSYFGRVTKGHIAHAVREAVSEEDAERIARLKKPDMAKAAEDLIAATHWLPVMLRTKAATEPESEAQTPEEPESEPETEPLPEAAE